MSAFDAVGLAESACERLVTFAPALLFAPEKSRTASAPHAGSPAGLLETAGLERPARLDLGLEGADVTAGRPLLLLAGAIAIEVARARLPVLFLPGLSDCSPCRRAAAVSRG